MVDILSVNEVEARIISNILGIEKIDFKYTIEDIENCAKNISKILKLQVMIQKINFQEKTL